MRRDGLESERAELAARERPCATRTSAAGRASGAPVARSGLARQDRPMRGEQRAEPTSEIGERMIAARPSGVEGAARRRTRTARRGSRRRRSRPRCRRSRAAAAARRRRARPKTATQTGMSAMSRAVMPDGMVCSPNATRPMPPPSSRRPTMSAVAPFASGRAPNERAAIAQQRPADQERAGGAEPGRGHEERREGLDGDGDRQVGRAPDDVEHQHPSQTGPRSAGAGDSFGIGGWSKAGTAYSPGPSSARGGAGWCPRPAGGQAARAAPESGRQTRHGRYPASRRGPQRAERDPVPRRDPARVAAGRQADDLGRVGAQVADARRGQRLESVGVEALAAQDRPLVLRAAQRVLPDRAVRPDDPMAGHDQRHRVVAERRADRPDRLRAGRSRRRPSRTAGPRRAGSRGPCARRPARTGCARAGRGRCARGGRRPAAARSRSPAGPAALGRVGGSAGDRPVAGNERGRRRTPRRRATRRGRSKPRTAARSGSRCGHTDRPGRPRRARSGAARLGPARPARRAPPRSLRRWSVMRSSPGARGWASASRHRSQHRDPPVDLGLDGALRTAEGLRDLGVGQAVDVAEHDGRSVGGTGRLARRIAQASRAAWRSTIADGRAARERSGRGRASCRPAPQGRATTGPLRGAPGDRPCSGTGSARSWRATVGVGAPGSGRRRSSTSAR